MASEGEEGSGGGPVFWDAFPVDVPSARLDQRLAELGRRRKRFTGSARSPYGEPAAATLATGVALVLVGIVLAFVFPAPVRWIALGVAVVLFALTVVLVWWLRGKHVRHQAEQAAVFDFHERGAVYREPQRLQVFSWAAVGKVIFAPDSNRGRTSELIISLAPEQPLIMGTAMSVEVLRNVLKLTSEFFTIDTMHKIARRLHGLFGHLKVVARPRDRKLYRLD
jgi:hypothetical protein